MRSIKQRLKYTAFAVTSFCLLLPSLAQAAPELVADFTPGPQSSDISYRVVVEGRLKVTVKSPGTDIVPPERQIFIDSDGTQSPLPIVQDEYYSSIEFDGRLFPNAF